MQELITKQESERTRFSGKRDEQESKGQDFFGKRAEQVKQRKTVLFGNSMVRNRHWFTGLSGE